MSFGRGSHTLGRRAGAEVTVILHPTIAVHASPSWRPLPRAVRKRLEIAAAEVSVARRGFHCRRASTQRRLEHIGEVFLCGYHAALDASTSEGLVVSLESVEREDRGFAYEGAAMGMAMLGILLPWRWSELKAFLEKDRHPYLTHVGVGWALAVLPVPLGVFLRGLDPLLRWLAVDGFGFHHGYFGPRRHLWERRVPLRVRGYSRRAFDQGLGRALWFAEGAEIGDVLRTVSAFPERRRADLWSGLGVACAYAGGIDDDAMRGLRLAAGPYRPALAQGVCFAAKARQRAANPAPHTERACRELCGMTADAAARITDEALCDLGHGRAEDYETWRRGIQARFQEETHMG